MSTILTNTGNSFPLSPVTYKKINFSDVPPATDYLDTKSILSGTENSLTITTDSWIINEWIDKVVRIERNGDFEFAIVQSNTENTMIFDDDLIFIPCNLCIVKILNTFVVQAQRLDEMIALNTLTGFPTAVILPKSTAVIERLYAHVYLERGFTSSVECPIICRGLDRQAGIKYGTLDYASEGVRLYAHQWFTPHYDIIQTYNVKRLATAYFDNAEDITSDVWQYMGNTDNLIYDNKKRFVTVNRDGKVWLRYVSLLVRDFNVTFSTTISKTGGIGEASICIAKRDSITEVITVLETRVSTTRFASGIGTNDLQVSIPVTLKRNDELIGVALRTSGTFTLDGGSSIEIHEF